MTSRPTKQNKLIYVYALVDRDRFKRDKDLFKHALYIGKGVGSRMSDHMKEVEKCLVDEARLESASNKKKIQALMSQVRSGNTVQAIRISAGYSTHADAYLAEALAITLIQAYRQANKGLPPLLNAVNGHHAQRISDMQEHFLYTQSEDFLLPRRPDEYAIFVKTLDREVNDCHWAELKRPFIHAGEVVSRKKIVVMSARKEKAARREWNPLDPWDEEEALARSQRYWPFDLKRLLSWIDGSPERPTWLLAGVPDGKDTVVRYAWKIDWNAPWQSFGPKWGIPVAGGTCDHYLLGKRLMEMRAGKKVQVLTSAAMGVRVIGISKKRPLATYR